MNTKKRRKIVSILLALILILTGLSTTAEAYLPTPNPNTPHSNNGWVELNGPLGVAALKEYLKDENNTWYIRLTVNISEDKFGGITVKGTKYLDLNGYTINANTDYGEANSMFFVPEGSTIVVCDSRGGGKIHYDGYLYMDYDYKKESPKERHLFSVTGTMILNGGSVYGGRDFQAGVSS